MSNTLDEFQYDDDIVRKFTFATIGWAPVATLAGLFIALELVLGKPHPRRTDPHEPTLTTQDSSMHPDTESSSPSPAGSLTGHEGSA